jgi:hypothetical protein
MNLEFETVSMQRQSVAGSCGQNEADACTASGPSGSDFAVGVALRADNLPVPGVAASTTPHPARGFGDHPPAQLRLGVVGT